MKNGDTSRIIVAITYTLVLCILLVAGTQAVPSRQTFGPWHLLTQPRLRAFDVPADEAVGEESYLSEQHSDSASLP